MISRRIQAVEKKLAISRNLSGSKIHEGIILATRRNTKPIKANEFQCNFPRDVMFAKFGTVNPDYLGKGDEFRQQRTYSEISKH